MARRTKMAIFGFRGPQSTRVASVYPDGLVYWLMSDRYYEGTIEDRNRFLAQLQKLSLLPSDLDPSQVVDGRFTQRRVDALTAEEFVEFVGILREMTGAPTTVVSP